MAALGKVASREHLRATGSAMDAIEHAVKSGEALAKARELCDWGLWEDFIKHDFNGSLRTAQRYMRLAKHWRQVAAQHPMALTSQASAAKALTAIMRGDAAPASATAPKQKRHARVAFVKDRAAGGVRHALQVLQDLNVLLTDLQPKSHQLLHATHFLRRGIGQLENTLAGVLGPDDVQPPGVASGESSGRVDSIAAGGTERDCDRGNGDREDCHE
ncbi:MAG TPA: DUF3102 domain-containing protein [Pirellulales bacterium]|nr:DUF3102 domain-containing protein [Pirellulales bacterium]